MTAATSDLATICEQLPEDKRAALTHFARFLLAEADDARWETLLDHPHPRPKLDAFLKASSEEPAELLDPDRL